MLDILFENPIIFGVIIYFLWSLFKPSKQQKQGQRRPTQPSPSVNEEGNRQPKQPSRYETRSEPKTIAQTSPPHRTEINRPKVALSQSQNNSTKTFDYEAEKKRIEMRKKQAEEALKSIRGIESSGTSQRSNHGYRSAMSNRLRKPTKEQLREGILWSEILSKPKATRRTIK